MNNELVAVFGADIYEANPPRWWRKWPPWRRPRVVHVGFRHGGPAEPRMGISWDSFGTARLDFGGQPQPDSGGGE
jgi:hypothetical protein